MTVGIRQLMGELERVRDVFHTAVYVDRDVDAAMACTAPDCVLVTEPGSGGATGAGLRSYLSREVIGHLPADLDFRRISRTTDRWRVVDESAVCFTHDRELPWLLPGTPATGRRVEVLMISIVTVRQSRITAHRTLWDQAGLLRQLALTPAALTPAALTPAAGR